MSCSVVDVSPWYQGIIFLISSTLRTWPTTVTSPSTARARVIITPKASPKPRLPHFWKG